ncbi:MAG: 7-cyano-7-deazaguanine synthase [Nitrospira sp.]|nr:7-cyano-7-deazaguanine synthase [Nitrospira sp.]
MSIVTLVSGGLDSTVMAVLTREEGLTQFPLFIDYGQLGRDKELRACQMNFKQHGLPEPKLASLNGYGGLLSSGLTDSSKHILTDAFLPCRNLMFLTVGAAYAFQCGATAVGIGLLDEAFSLFPDQTKGFLSDAEALLSRALGKSIKVITPLITFSKADVLKIAKAKGITGTYSCHAGTDIPCGACVACREYIGLEV